VKGEIYRKTWKRNEENGKMGGTRSKASRGNMETEGRKGSGIRKGKGEGD